MSGTAAPKRIEDEFYKIMKKFNNKTWLQFARNKDGLGLPEYQIDDIQQDHSRDTKEQKYQMLMVWKRKNNRASIEYLNGLVDRFLSLPDDASAEPARNPEPAYGDVAAQETGQRDLSSVLETGQRNLSPVSQMPVQDNKMHDEPTPSQDDSLHGAQIQPESIRINIDDLIPNHAFSSLHNQSSNAASGRQPIANERSIRVHGERSLPGRAVGDQDTTPMETTKTSSRPKTSAAPIRNVTNFERPQTSGNNRCLGLPNFTFPGVDMRNTQINVYGQQAIGVQINTNIGKNETRELKLTPEQLKKYCSEIEHIDVLPSEKSDYSNHFLGQDVYRITHKPKGAVLIINNMVCGNKTESTRSEIDIRNLETMWEKMGCRTILRTRSDAEEARSTFKKFADSKTASQSDFIAVVILAKGDYVRNAGVFYGADDYHVNVKEAIEAFNDENAVKLRSIPKLFFLQFCVENKASALYEKMAREICEARSQTPNMLISHAVQPSRDIFCNFTGASWYINAITSVFMNHARNQDVHQLMEMVGSAILHNLASTDGRLSCDFISTLKKRLLFFPGFPEDPEDEFD